MDFVYILGLLYYNDGFPLLLVGRNANVRTKNWKLWTSNDKIMIIGLLKYLIIPSGTRFCAFNLISIVSCQYLRCEIVALTTGLSAAAGGAHHITWWRVFVLKVVTHQRWLPWYLIPPCVMSRGLFSWGWRAVKFYKFHDHNRSNTNKEASQLSHELCYTYSPLSCFVLTVLVRQPQFKRNV